jgi:hypothetical protein
MEKREAFRLIGRNRITIAIAIVKKSLNAQLQWHSAIPYYLACNNKYDNKTTPTGVLWVVLSYLDFRFSPYQRNYFRAQR